MHLQRCPYCETVCHADWVDVGPGMVQCGPFHCDNCHASEIGPYDNPRPLSVDEERTGWYAPNSDPGSSANVVCGQIVSADIAKKIYEDMWPISATPRGREMIRHPEFGPHEMLEAILEQKAKREAKKLLKEMSK